jgi:hypothetical protein
MNRVTDLALGLTERLDRPIRPYHETVVDVLTSATQCAGSGVKCEIFRLHSRWMLDLVCRPRDLRESVHA